MQMIRIITWTTAYCKGTIIYFKKNYKSNLKKKKSVTDINTKKKKLKKRGFAHLFIRKYYQK